MQYSQQLLRLSNHLSRSPGHGWTSLGEGIHASHVVCEKKGGANF